MGIATDLGCLNSEQARELQTERDRLAALNVELVDMLTDLMRDQDITGWTRRVSIRTLLAKARVDNDDRSEAQVARMIEDEEQPKGRVP